MSDHTTAGQPAQHTKEPGWYISDRKLGIFNGPYKHIETAGEVRRMREDRMPERADWNLCISWMGDVTKKVSRETYDAAPALLEALKGVVKAYEARGFADTPDIIAARAAVALAEGKQP